MPTPPLPSADFSRVARVYDWLASLVFGRAQRRAQLAALQAGLPLAGPAPRVLVLGGGPGWVLTELLRQCPAAQVLYLETSAAMLAQAQARLARYAPALAAQVAFRRGSERDLRPEEQFDAIVTFFVLDCFTLAEFPAAMARLHAEHVSIFWGHSGPARSAATALAQRAGRAWHYEYLCVLFLLQIHHRPNLALSWLFGRAASLLC